MSTEQTQQLQQVEIVGILPTAIWIENDITGGRSVMLQHEGCPPFEYARFGYSYMYTSNAGTWSDAVSLAKQLGAQEPVEQRNRPMNPFPTREEVLEQIQDLQDYLAELDREDSESGGLAEGVSDGSSS